MSFSFVFPLVGGSGGGGTVSSVGLSMPTDDFNIANSPVTGSDTIAVTYKSQIQNLIFGSPDGITGTPLFRYLVGADLPSATTSVKGALPIATDTEALAGSITDKIIVPETLSYTFLNRQIGAITAINSAILATDTINGAFAKTQGQINAKQNTLTVGDITGSEFSITGGVGAVIGTGVSLSLATSGVTANTYGSSTVVPVVTVNSKGIITGVTTASIAFPPSSVTSVFGRSGAVTAQSGDYTFAQISSTPTTLAGYGITDAVTTGGSGSVSDISITGLAGSGFLNLRYQSSVPVGLANYGTLYADSIGNIGYKKNANAFTNSLSFSGTADRVYTLQDRSGTLADNIDLALKAPIASPTFTGTVTTPDAVVSNATGSTPTFFDTAKKLITTTAQLWGTWVQTWGSKATPVDADTIGFHDSASTFVGVKSTLLNLWTTYFKVKADLLYLKSAGLTANYLPYFNGTNLVNSTLQRGADFIATTTQVIAGRTISGGQTAYTGRYNQNLHPDLYGVDTMQAAILNSTVKGLHLYNAGLFMPYIQTSGWLNRTTGIQKYHDGQDFGGGNNPSWNYSGPYPAGVYHAYVSLSNLTDTSEAYITVNDIGNVTNIDVIKPSSNITFSIVTNKVNIAATGIVAIFKYIGESKTNSQLINQKYSSTGLASYWTGSEGFGVGHSSQNASAIGQFDSTTKGVLLPRMTTVQKELISDVDGLLAYDTDFKGLCQNDGVRWTTFAKGGTSLVFVFVKSDFPAPSGGIITLLANTTYFINGTIDLTGDRLVCSANTTIIGGSSENCRIKSTGLVSALITSVYSLPIRNITIEASLALNLDGDGTTTALDWFGVNFTDCAVIGTVKDYTNFIMSDCAFLNSGGMTLDGTFGSVGFSQSLFDCNTANTVFILPATCTITRRFRIIYSSFVVGSGETGININASATIPTESYILVTVNFSGGGTYITGVTHTSNDSLFSNCTGITNTAVNGQLYMQANATATTVSATNTFYKVLGTTTASADNSKFTHSNNRLTCDAVISRKYLLHCDLSFSSTATNVCEFGFYDSQLSAVRTPSKTKSTANSAGRAENISFGCVVTMVSGDYIEIHTANTSAVNDITVDQLNFIITEIR